MENLRGNVEDQVVPLQLDPVAGWSAAFGESPFLTPVDFRSLTPEAIARDRSTHLLHPYPAKLIPEIPHLFLRSGLVAKTSQRLRVADPFCGSGTVLVEGILAGWDVVGADTNPLARLIARVKTRSVASERITRSLANVCRWIEILEAPEPPPVVNIKYWYSKRIIAELSKVREAIAKIRSNDVREFMLVCLSVCARKLSYADPRLSVPVKINKSRQQQYGSHFTQLNNHLKFLGSVNVAEYFVSVVLRNADRLERLNFEKYKSAKVSIFGDALAYLGAQKYIRASSLSLGWVDLAHEKDLRELERRTLGREHFAKSELGTAPVSGIAEADDLINDVCQQNPLRAHIAWTYLHEMEVAIRSIFMLLKDSACAIIVVVSCTRFRRHRVWCFMEQEVRHGEKAVYARVQA